jgi:glycerol transport system ATP-binding protein
VVVMHDGAVVQTGTPEELFERPAHTFVGHFIGSPGMNVMPCRVEGATAYIDSQPIRLQRAYPALPQGQRIELGIRPEFVQLQARGNGFPVRLKRIDDIGRARIARVEMGGRPVSASVPEGLAIEGEEAALGFDTRHAHIYADGHLVTGEPAAAEGHR